VLEQVLTIGDDALDDQLTRALDAAVRADLLTRRAQTLAREVGLDRACRVPRLLPQG